MKFPSLSHLAGVVRESVPKILDAIAEACNSSCVRICFSNTSFAATRSILTDKMWCSAFRHRMLHKTKSLLGHILSMVDESVRQASVTEVPRAILNNFQPTRISIEESNPKKFTFWDIQRRTGTDSSLQLERKGVSPTQKTARCCGTQVYSSTLNLRNMP